MPTENKNMIKATFAEITRLRKAGATFEIFLRPVTKRNAIWYGINFVMVGARGDREEGFVVTVKGKEYLRQDLQKLVELIRIEFPETEGFCGDLYPDNFKKFNTK